MSIDEKRRNFFVTNRDRRASSREEEIALSAIVTETAMSKQDSLIMSVERASLKQYPHDWISQFFYKWQERVERNCRLWLFHNPHDSEEACSQLTTEIFELLSYVNDFHQRIDECGISKAVNQKACTRIPCIEKQPKRRKDLSKSELKEILKNEQRDRAERLTLALEHRTTLPGLSEAEADEYRLLLAVLLTRYRSSQFLVETFLYWKAREKCTCVAREAGKLTYFASETVDRHNDDHSPDWVVERMDFESAMNQLSEASQDAIRLRIAGHSDKEAADILGVNVVAFRKKISRAKLALKEILSDRDECLDC